jgi:hypothetical protein
VRANLFLCRGLLFWILGWFTHWVSVTRLSLNSATIFAPSSFISQYHSERPRARLQRRAGREEKHRFAALHSELCGGVPQPAQMTGRPRLPLGDMVFASVCKTYCGFSSRRFGTDLREAHTNGLIRRVPHFNSVSRYPYSPKV